MKRNFPLIIAAVLLFSGCDSPIGFNIFSSFRNTDNVSVTEAIASGDEDLMEIVYNRELSRLASVNPTAEPAKYIDISLGIADLQTARSKAIFLFLALIAVEVTNIEVEEVIVQKVIETYLRDVTDKVRDVITNYSGEPSPTQNFISVLGLVVWWYYVAEDLGLDVSAMIDAYNNSNLAGYLTDNSVDVEADSSYYANESELTTALGDDVVYMTTYLNLILTDDQIEQLPDLKNAVGKVQTLYSLGS